MGAGVLPEPGVAKYAGGLRGVRGVLRKVLRGVSRDNGRDSVLREPQ